MSVTGKAVALDTSLAIALINGGRGPGSVAAWVESFSDPCLPTHVVGELLFGAMNSGRPRENLGAIDGLSSKCRLLVADLGTARAYAQIRARLKKAGSPIPENDIWIAAACVQHVIPLATVDAHFSKVEGLVVVAP